MTHVFISHSSKDDTTVNKICERLHAAKFTTWIDHKDGKGGDYFYAVIQEAINDCDAVLFVISPNSITSADCQGEWKHTIDIKKPLYPVLIEEIPTADFPFRLKIINYVSLIDDFDAGMNALISAIDANASLDENAPQVETAFALSGTIDEKLTDIPMSGRDDDLKDVLANLEKSVTFIIGYGGAGKSRLAAEVIKTMPNIDGAVWHLASDVSRADQVIEALRDQLGLPDTADRADVLAALKKSRRLVVIDNAESIKSDTRAAYVTLIKDLRANGGKVLVTTRSLHEWDNDLPTAYRITPAALSVEVGARIVNDMTRAFDVKRDLSGKTNEIAQAARLHPRLIEWGVRLCHNFPTDKVIADLRELRGKTVQDALDEMILKTVRQMVEAEGTETEAALRRLTVCRGGFTYEASRFLLDEGMLQLALKLDFGLAQSLAAQNDDKHDALLTALQTWQFVTLRDHNEQERYFIDPLVIEVAKTDPAAGSPHYDYYKALALQHNKSQDYYGLDVESANLDTAFAWAIENDPEDALNLANACGHFLANRGRFGQNLERFERVASALADPLTDHSDKTLWANAQNSLGATLRELPTGDRRNNLRRAVAAYEAALEHYTPQAAPLSYAMTQNNLGAAYSALAGIEEREGNLRKAVAAYEAALEYRTPQAAPLDYAMTQNNLGNAYSDLAGVEEREGNLRKAVAAYEAALEHYTPQTAPLDYAATQNNLGNAYWNLAGVEERDGNLRKAVAAYEAALVYYTPQAAPLDYAMTQNNLGTAYSALAGVEEREGNLRKAVAAYEAALVYWTPQTAPLAYAMTQNNLGNAYRDLAGIEDREGNLRKAVAAYEAALHFHTPDAAPYDYAMTQKNLGITYEDLGDLPAAITCWREAEKYYRVMGYIAQADLMLEWIADGEKRLNDGGA